MQIYEGQEDQLFAGAFVGSRTLGKNHGAFLASAHKIEVNTPKRGPVYLDFMGIVFSAACFLERVNGVISLAFDELANDIMHDLISKIYEVKEEDEVVVAGELAMAAAAP